MKTSFLRRRLRGLFFEQAFGRVADLGRLVHSGGGAAVGRRRRAAADPAWHGLQPLEERMMMNGDPTTPIITEFMASNTTGLEDEDGDTSDWVEVFNPTNAPVNLSGWHLTDNFAVLDKWTFPNITLQPGAFLTVFASNKDRRNPASELHTNFNLASEGEYLGLVMPDGVTIAHDFGMIYPQQVANVSYGLVADVQTVQLIGPQATVNSLIPADASLDDLEIISGARWIDAEFDDSSWASGQTGAGFIAIPTPQTTLDDFEDGVIAPAWTVSIPGGSTAIVTETGGAMRLDAPTNTNSFTTRGLAPFVYRDAPNAESYSIITHLDTTTQTNTSLAGLMIYNPDTNLMGLALQFLNNTSVVLQSPGFSLATVNPALAGQRNIWLRLDRLGATDSWKAFYKLSEPAAWIELATVTEGVGNVGQIPNPKPGMLARGINNRIVADFRSFEMTTIVAAPGGGPNFEPLIEHDLEADMFNVSPTAYLRVPFEITGDPDDFDALTLDMAYDDGFVAYLNGEEIAGANDPLTRGFNSTSTARGLHPGISFTNFASAGGMQLNGSAALTANRLRLTPATTSQAGSAFTTTPIPLPDDYSFSTSFSFELTGGGGSADVDGVGADGFTFALHKSASGAAALGSLGAGIGIFGVSPMLAIEFDTWHQGNFDPASNANTNGNHIGVDISSAATSIAQTGPLPRFNNGGVFFAWVDYDGATQTLSIYHSTTNTKPVSPTLTTTVDLATLFSNDHSLYAGFTAGTGGAYNNHDILSWAFSPGQGDGAARVSLDISDYRSRLQPGMNVLAIHGLNFSVSDSDFLILPTLRAQTFGSFDLQTPRYFQQPTPGQVNSAGVASPGPVITNLTHSFAGSRPTTADSILVTAMLAEALAPVAGAELHYRLAYGAEVVISMRDDGMGGDENAGDGVYSATIPGGIGTAGNLVRWYVTATDELANASRWPLFLSATASPQYEGTVYGNPGVSSGADIFEWFVAPGTEAAALTRTGTRAGVFFLNQYYDNVFVRRRGDSSSSGFPKAHLKFDFNPGNKFLYDPEEGRVEEINVQSTWVEKAYIRRVLAWETYDAAGVPGSDSMMLHVRQNGAFWGVYVFESQPDDDLLEQHGLDPNGALYKMRSQLEPGGVSAAFARSDTADDLSILTSLVNGINPALPLAQRETYLFDNVNLPEVISYIAASVIMHENDHMSKNYYVYQDTFGTGEWQMLPWDKDLTFGKNWDPNANGVFNDTMWANLDVIANANASPSHPFFGDNDHQKNDNLWNRLFDAIFDVPETREMYLRRLRTLMDQILQPPGTPTNERILEARIDELAASIAPDVLLDIARWGNPPGTVQTLAQAVTILKEQYLDPRRVHLYTTHSIDNLSTSNPVIISGEVGNTTARYFIPNDDSLGLTWTQRTFVDAAWPQGPTGIGYERDVAATYTPLLGTSIDAQMTGRTSFFTRIPFNVSDPGALTALTLKLKYDDGFVAFINGVEVARRNVTGNSWNATASDHPDSASLIYENFVISNTGNLLGLVAGQNILAIHGVNSGSASSDLLILPELVEGVISSSVKGIAGIPHAQSTNPLITVASVEFNPASGNQDQEYIQFTNPNATAVDISGWRVASAVDHTFAPGTVIPAGGSLYLTPDSKAFRARTTGPRGGQSLFVQGGYGGHLSNFGETIELYGSNDALVSSHTYTGDPTDAQEQLRITEINYNPSEPTTSEITAGFTDNDQFEFIELRNISGTLPLSLLDIEFVSGVTFNFTGAAITTLAPGARVLIVADAAAFTARYGAGLPIAGQYTGSLSNNGESIKIEDSTNSTIVEFSYSDNSDWPGRADGNGSTLQIIDVDGNYNAPNNWRSSGLYNGSPGAEDILTLDVIINEVLTHTDLPQRDSIELYNTTNSPIDLSGWWISDSKNYTKFQIPSGTMIDANGYLVFDEEDFNPTPGTPAANHFSFNGAHGEEAHLLRGAIGNPVPLSFADGVDFDAAFNGISFGRVPDGDPSGQLFPNISYTPGAPNSGPKFGPLVISEVMYNAAGGDNDLEFIELYNSSRFAIDLTNWRLAGAADFDFAPGAIIGPRQTLVILGFDPLEPLNADKIAAFELAYSVTIGGSFVGPFLGNLANEGERVKLQAPDDEPLDEPGFIPHPLHDEVKYDDALPWPPGANGLGDSLQRYTPKSYGHDAASWRGQTPTPGRARGDINGDGIINAADIDMLFENIGSASQLHDLTTDGTTDTLDIDLLVQEILCTFYGDADLNQQVSIGDLTVLAEHFGEVGTASWSTGDFNGDKSVSIGDLTRLAENFGSFNALTAEGDSDSAGNNNGGATPPAGLQALGDGTPGASDDDEEDDDALIDILADLGEDLR